MWAVLTGYTHGTIKLKGKRNRAQRHTIRVYKWDISENICAPKTISITDFSILMPNNVLFL